MSDENSSGPSLLFKKSLNQAMSSSGSWNKLGGEDRKRSGDDNRFTSVEVLSAEDSSTNDIIREGLKNIGRCNTAPAQGQKPRGMSLRGRGRFKRSSPSFLGSESRSSPTSLSNGMTQSSYGDGNTNVIPSSEHPSQEAEKSSAGCKLGNNILKGAVPAPDGNTRPESKSAPLAQHQVDSLDENSIDRTQNCTKDVISNTKHLSKVQVPKSLMSIEPLPAYQRLRASSLRRKDFDNEDNKAVKSADFRNKQRTEKTKHSRRGYSRNYNFEADNMKFRNEMKRGEKRQIFSGKQLTVQSRTACAERESNQRTNGKSSTFPCGDGRRQNPTRGDAGGSREPKANEKTDKINNNIVSTDIGRTVCDISCKNVTPTPTTEEDTSNQNVGAEKAMDFPNENETIERQDCHIPSHLSNSGSVKAREGNPRLDTASQEQFSEESSWCTTVVTTKFANNVDHEIKEKAEESAEALDVRESVNKTIKGLFHSYEKDTNSLELFDDRVTDSRVSYTSSEDSKELGHCFVSNSERDKENSSDSDRVSVSCDAKSEEEVASICEGSLSARVQKLSLDSVESHLQSGLEEQREMNGEDEGRQLPSVESGNTSDLCSKHSFETQYTSSVSEISSDVEVNDHTQSDEFGRSHARNFSPSGYEHEQMMPYPYHSYHNFVNPMYPDMTRWYSGWGGPAGWGGREDYMQGMMGAPYPWWHDSFQPRQFRVPVESVGSDRALDDVVTFIQMSLQEIEKYVKTLHSRQASVPMNAVITVQTSPSFPAGPHYSPPSAPSETESETHRRYGKNISPQMHGWAPPPQPLPTHRFPPSRSQPHSSSPHGVLPPAPPFSQWHEWYSHMMYGTSREAGASLAPDSSQQAYYPPQHYYRGQSGDGQHNFWAQEGRDKWPGPWMFPSGGYPERQRMSSSPPEELTEKDGVEGRHVYSPKPEYDGAIGAQQSLFDTREVSAKSTPLENDRRSSCSSASKRSRSSSRSRNQADKNGSSFSAEETSLVPPSKSSKQEAKRKAEANYRGSVSYFLNQEMLSNKWTTSPSSKSQGTTSQIVNKKPVRAYQREDEDGLHSSEVTPLFPAAAREATSLPSPAERHKFMPTLTRIGSTRTTQEEVPPIGCGYKGAWGLATQSPLSPPCKNEGDNTQGLHNVARQEQSSFLDSKSRRRSDPVRNASTYDSSDLRRDSLNRSLTGKRLESESEGSVTSSGSRRRAQAETNWRRIDFPRVCQPFAKFSDFQDWATAFVEGSKKYQHKFIDSHCHIDFMYSRLGLDRDTSYGLFREKHSSTFPVNYEGCVAVFCNPKTFLNTDTSLYPTIRALQNEEGVWFAFGCHPKSATEFMTNHQIGLKRLLSLKQTVALGEIGLDYSSGFDRHKVVQKEVFRVQLHIAVEHNLPLVIHCRDADDDCLSIMKEIVPREHKIHAHCFTRNWPTAQRWLNMFPNLWLGLTPLISYKTATSAIDTATNLPLNRLLLETDAPYFVPGTAHNGSPQFSHPGFALFTAEMVAKLQGVNVDEVLKACRENTRSMYGV